MLARSHFIFAMILQVARILCIFLVSSMGPEEGSRHVEPDGPGGLGSVAGC